ncbi:MAG: redoxin domain-containing protein [Planctomycetes bacterium]|nr:redoxin domain-containing protein [Planctomycetota bacterium]
MRSGPLLVAIAALALSSGSWAYGQDQTPDGAKNEQPQGERGRRPPRDRFDPSKDEVLQTIRDAVAPSDEQMQQIVDRYRQLRQDQRDAMRQVMRGSRGDGQRPRERRDRQRGDRRDRREMMENLRETLQPINAQFLADARAILDAARQEAWDACAAGLDLMPQRGRGGRGGPDPAKGPNVGEPAPDFELADLDGKRLNLKSLRGKPVVVEFGSYTCPVFRRQVDDLAALRAEYGDEVQWLMIYTAEAHPTDGRVAPINSRAGIEIPQHTSFEKRLECAKLCKEKLNLKLHVLVDGFDDKVTKAYGGHPNRGYVVDREGKIVSKQIWIEPVATRKALNAILERTDSETPKIAPASS